MTEITTASRRDPADLALTEIDGEPRALDLDIAARLGMARPTNIRQLIERNREELETFGSLHRSRAMIEAGKGAEREVTEYRLNEEQALTIAQISRAPNAKEVRGMLVKVFVAWRRGQLIDQAGDGHDLAARTNGISRMLAEKVTGMEKLLADMSARFDQFAALAAAAQPGTALVTTHASANEIAIERGAKQKGRHGLTVRIGNFLELACRDAGEQVLPGRDGKRMFPRSIMMGHVLDYVDALVADHNRALDAQGDLLGTGRRRALAKVAVADTIIGAAREGLAALVFGDELIFFDTTADDVEEGAEVVAALYTRIGGAGRFVPCIAGERQPGYGPLARPVHGPHVRSAFPLIYRVAGPIVGRQPLHRAA